MNAKLFCIVVGHRIVLAVDIDLSLSVADLKKAIKKEDPELISCGAAHLKLYLARDEDLWLNVTHPAYRALKRGDFPDGINSLMREELELADPLALCDDEYFGGAHVHANGDIHVLVELPATGAAQRVENRDPPRAAVIHSVNRLARWRDLNEILDKNKMAKKTTDDDDTSTGDCCVQWSDVKRALDYDHYIQNRKPLTDLRAFENLVQFLAFASKAMGSYWFASRAKRRHFITPVLITVCSLFDDATLGIDTSVHGNDIHASGRFDFVLSRGKTRICIVEAKTNDFEQERAQVLVGCEVMADHEELHVVYGVVTNFIKWHIFRCDENSILMDYRTLSATSEELDVDSLREVCEVIYAVFLEHDDEGNKANGEQGMKEKDVVAPDVL